MFNNHIPDSLSDALGDQHDSDIVPGEEGPQLLINLFISGVTFNDEEVLLTSLVSLAHPGQKETSNG